jgi:chemotaxis protein CheX
VSGKQQGESVWKMQVDCPFILTPYFSAEALKLSWSDKPMDVQLAKPFVDATVNILSTMAMITPTVQKPYLKTSNKALGDVSGIVGVTSEKGQHGVISVSFTKSCAIAVVKNLVGEVEDVISDVQDAVGELTNMISGQARQKLVDMGITLSSATPTVIMGDGHSITHVTRNNIMVVPFQTEYGQFVVEFSFSDETTF